MRKALLNEFMALVQNDVRHEAYSTVIEHPTADSILDLEIYRNRANQLAVMIFDLPDTHERPLDSIEDAVYLVKSAAPNMCWWTVEWNNCQGHWASLKFDVREGHKNEVHVYSGGGDNGASALIVSFTKYLDDKPRLKDLHEAALKQGERELENASS